MAINFVTADESLANKIHLLDNLIFSKNDVDVFPSTLGELTESVKTGNIIVAVEGSQLLGFVRSERLPGNVYHIVSVGVIPEARHRGIGKRLVGEVMKYYRRNVNRVKIFAVCSPYNYVMVGILQYYGFIGKHYIQDYFGDSSNVVYFEYESYKDSLVDSRVESIYIPETSVKTVESLLSREWRITGLVFAGKYKMLILGKHRSQGVV